jgi:hypothetical protein
VLLLLLLLLSVQDDPRLGVGMPLLFRLSNDTEFIQRRLRVGKKESERSIDARSVRSPRPALEYDQRRGEPSYWSSVCDCLRTSAGGIRQGCEEAGWPGSSAKKAERLWLDRLLDSSRSEKEGRPRTSQGGKVSEKGLSVSMEEREVSGGLGVTAVDALEPPLCVSTSERLGAPEEKQAWAPLGVVKLGLHGWDRVKALETLGNPERVHASAGTTVLGPWIRVHIALWAPCDCTARAAIMCAALSGPNYPPVHGQRSGGARNTLRAKHTDLSMRMHCQSMDGYRTAAFLEKENTVATWRANLCHAVLYKLITARNVVHD